MPLFAYEYGDTGAGNDVGIADNWAAFDAIKIVPKYGVMPSLPPTEVELFGTRYAAPIGIAPMGGPSLVWPGADLLMAKAAQAARVPYTLAEANNLFSESKFAKKAFGEDVVEHYAHFFRTEVAAYDKAVTDWELKRYFERI